MTFNVDGAHVVLASHLRPGDRFSESDMDQAYLRNAHEEMENLRSYVVEVLTGPADAFVKSNILAGLRGIDSNLRKALM